MPDGRLFLLLDRLSGKLLERGGHHINVPSLEEDKIAGRLNGNILLERKVQTVFAGSPLKGLDVAIRHFNVGNGGILAHQMLDGLLAAIGFGLLHLLLRLLDLLNELVQSLFQHFGGDFAALDHDCNNFGVDFILHCGVYLLSLE